MLLFRCSSAAIMVPANSQPFSGIDPIVVNEAQEIIKELKRLQELTLTLSDQVLHLTTVDDKVSQVIEKSLKQGIKTLTIKLNDASITE